MASAPRRVAGILDDLKAAASLLDAAQYDWPGALQAELPNEDAPEVPRIEDLLHSATHETAGTLAMTIRDIEALLQRVELRRKFAIFSAEQFGRIVREGWSTRLAAELHPQIPSTTLAELSTRIKQLCTDWESLPPVAASDH
jgi:hypothetical protein